MTGQAAQQLAAQRHDTGAVFEREDAGHHGGCDLALTVTDHRRRHHAEAAPYGCQADIHCKQGRLDHVHPLQQTGINALIAAKH